MKRIALLLISFLMINASAALAASDGNYTVRSGDTLTIEVLEDATLNRTVLVLPDGRFSFPYAGTVRAAGQTVGQIQRAVSSGISSEFREAPTVFVSVSGIPQRAAAGGQEAAVDTIDVYVVGEVNAPGPKSVKSGTTLLQFFAQSGGFTKFAATKRVQLRRRDKSGAERIYKINYRALTNGAAMQNDIVLSEGDVLLVPERRLFE